MGCGGDTRRCKCNCNRIAQAANSVGSTLAKPEDGRGVLLQSDEPIKAAPGKKLSGEE
jgi:hypothetical protein